MGRYGFVGGLPVAAAYVAGVIALFIEANHRQRMSLNFLKESLRMSSLPILALSFTMTDPIINQGSSLVNIKKAVGINILVAPSLINSLDTSNKSRYDYRTHKLNIINSSL